MTKNEKEQLSCGDRVTIKGIEKWALSPLPITNNRHPIAVTKFASVNNHGLLELRATNSAVGIVQLGIFILLMNLGFVAGFIAFGYLYAFFPILPIFVFFFLCVGGTYYFGFKDIRESSKKNLPLIFNPQRQELLISYNKSNGLIRPSFFGAFTNNGYSKGVSDGIIIMGFLGFMVFSGGWGLFFYERFDIETAIIATTLILVGIALLYIPLKPWFIYFYQVRKQPKEEKQQFIGVPWEKVAVELHHLSAVSYIGLQTRFSLNFICPLPEKDKKYLISLPVYSIEEGLSLFELIRDYMEHGAEGIENTAASEIQTEEDYSRKAYSRKIDDMRRNNPTSYPFWRVWNILTFRYFAHWFIERDLDVLPKKIKNQEEVINWCQPIPKSQWQPMSNKLKEANKRVRELYEEGFKWESDKVREVLKEYAQN